MAFFWTLKCTFGVLGFWGSVGGQGGSFSGANHFSYRFRIFSGAVSFCRRAALTCGIPCLCPAKERGFLAKTAKMTNLRSKQ